MKKNKLFYILLAFLLTALSGGMLQSCSEDDSSLELPYLFRPINVAVSLNGVNATITWSKIDSAAYYTIEIYKDSLQFNTDSLTLTDTLSSNSYTVELAGDTRYSVRIKANATDSTKDSKFNDVLTFETPKENLFSGYTSTMTALHTANIQWLAGSNVTHLLLKASGREDSIITLTSSDIEAGEMTIQLPNADYTVQLFNSTILRGSVEVVIEGDFYLTADDDLVTALTAATSGQTLILEPGTTFSMSSAYVLNKSIKIKGLSQSSLPVICMKSSTGTSTSNLLSFTASSTVGHVLFENVEFNGYCDNNSNATQIGYLFNNKTKTTVDTVSFTNCLMHDFVNTPMRISGNVEQQFNNIFFDDCIIYNMGSGGSYGIVHSNSKDYIVNVAFKNCTIYNFKNNLVLRTGAYEMGTVSITNCTVHKAVQETASTRYLLDLNNATFTGGIIIKNCILGSAGALACGLRSSSTATVSGSYYTTDFVDVSASLTTPVMTAYGSASTILWENPNAGDFTLKDATFAGKGVAGDSRWY
jgi:hypothetical protein